VEHFIYYVLSLSWISIVWNIGLCASYSKHFLMTKSVVLIVVDIDPQGSVGPSKGSINNHRVEWGH